MWKVTFVLFIFVMIVDACKPSNVVTFDVTPQEFLSEYNSDVSRDLHIITFKSGIIASVDEGNQFGNLNKYTLDFSRDSKSGNSILQNLGFYANRDGWKEYKKNGIKYRFDRDLTSGVFGLSMGAVKE